MRVAHLLTVALGCEPGALKTPLRCEAEVDLVVGTVLHVRWTAPDGGLSRVTFQADDTVTLQTPPQEGDSPDFLLVGMPGDTDVTWTGVTERDGELQSCTGVTRTAPIPPELPTVELVVASDAMSPSPAFFLGVTYNASGQSAVVALDRLGRVVWYAPTDLAGVSIQAERSRDGRGVIYNHVARSERGDEASVRWVTLDGTLVEVRDTPAAHHMFAQLPDDRIAFQQLDVKEIYNPELGASETWVGDAIAEVDADGTVTPIFSTWDWLEPTANDRMETYSTVDGLDWTHGNALKYDGERETYLLSLGHAADVIELSRATGAPLRILGADGYTVAEGAEFYFQHDPTLLDATHLTLHNHDPVTHEVTAVEYSIDDHTQTLTPVWSYASGRSSSFLGQVRRLETGNTWINYGQGAVLQEITPDGEVVWELASTDGLPFGQLELLDSLYTTPDAP